ncbi:MAG: penicillin-binding transpeptidase domain-containing protein [Bryobacteraceae bacterium]|nr:penicillin-binding transpeptidase domain-containing protein [Bryobacteraceae bacterium]
MQKLLPLLLVAASAAGFAATANKKVVSKPASTAKKKPATKATPAKAARPATKKAATRTAYVPPSKRRYRSYRQNWGEPTFADSTVGDRIEGEDLVVRRAAVEALGPYNGSVMVTDPVTGRILTIVNQKLALKGSFTPCSTIKLVTAIAGLVEEVFTPTTAMRCEGRQYMDLSMAMARSSNVYFSNLGKKLGFERVAYYSRLFGLGEKAAIGLDEETAGIFPDEEPQAGVGAIAYTGLGVQMTPLQLTALLSMIANNGNLPWLQYPRTREEIEGLTPQVKRQFDLTKVVDQILPGMQGAVDYGSATRARRFFEATDPIWGKTGTCTHADQRTHLGWFGSYNEIAGRKLVVVVLLTGGRPVNGPVASGIAGSVYRILSGQNFYATDRSTGSGQIILPPSFATQN